MIKKDNYIFGLVIGFLVPAILFMTIWGINYLLIEFKVARYYLDQETHALLSVAGNLLAIRYYFVNLTYDKTGRGVLLVTFALILIFFAFKDSIFHSL